MLLTTCKLAGSVRLRVASLDGKEDKTFLNEDFRMRRRETLQAKLYR